MIYLSSYNFIWASNTAPTLICLLALPMVLLQNAIHNISEISE